MECFWSRKSNPFAFQVRGECEFENRFLGHLYFQEHLCRLKKLQQFQEADKGKIDSPLSVRKLKQLGQAFTQIRGTGKLV